MAQGRIDHSTSLPAEPISPTEALELVRSQGSRSIDDAVADLNEWIRRKRVRLWCDDELVPPSFIMRSLVMVTVPDADGRPRVDVLPAGGIGWKSTGYTFKLDADEVRALLPPSSASVATGSDQAPKPREGTAEWVYEQMIADQSWRNGEPGYARRLYERRPACITAGEKRLANLISEHKAEVVKELLKREEERDKR
ncbi:hypothetical protein XH99_01005 [Bradyrhizobium nanningense]|uniref:Uncharacterized protein n=1 Tax=Bradyrhizobium nanningense TaxID=1325118 RepID=A0A4Q0SK06_9BRAD|nr:hypothetical protein [Bradyrhizobium nanningense]RXH34357.1 hypothetical protein XH84_06965 [Bradyrhizobium nanningense]RXH38371.1 hypothetical protein XH99_01005 [Bradyrhizobium nanningense]